MNAKELDKLKNEVLLHGPMRVVINDQGEAVPPARAREMGRPPPDVIFIRNDGWSLGATTSLWEVAKSLWADSWDAIMLRFHHGWQIRPWKSYCKLLEMAGDVIALRDARCDEAEDIDSWAKRLAADFPMDGDRNDQLVLAVHDRDKE